MRCDDVIRELATPTGTPDRASLADHLNNCPACATWAEHAARLDRLWQITQPAEPTSDVWDNVWVRVVSSLEVPATNGLQSVESALWNDLRNASLLKFETKPAERHLTCPFRIGRWATIGLLGLAQVAAVLLVAGMSWRFFVPARPVQHAAAASVPSVDIEEGQVVMIVADPKLLAVVDMTPMTTAPGVDRVDWYGDEKYFDWFLVYHEVESLAKPTVAMQE